MQYPLIDGNNLVLTILISDPLFKNSPIEANYLDLYLRRTIEIAHK
jgi:hypothetical protein